MSDWNYVPDRNMKKSATPRIRMSQFGDGYSQRMQDGINYMAQTWALEYVNRSWTTILAMVTFLEGKGGVTAFTFTPPGEAEIKVICKQWDVTTVVRSTTDADSFGSLSVSFERVYE